MGALCQPSVRYANKMVSRVCLLVLLILAKGCWFVLEQPKNSLMQHHARFQQLIRLTKLIRVSLNMGEFGAHTLKPSWLYSNVRWLSDILNFRTHVFELGAGKTIVNITCKKDGTKCVQGGKELKLSQEYPQKFGRGLAKVKNHNLKNAAELGRQMRLHSKNTKISLHLPVGTSSWSDAGLASVFALLY
jgi:hypothetical protein